MNKTPRTLLLLFAFTMILVGYLTVWLPNDLAGLSFIGVEVGEWVKFLPQMQSGEIVIPRELFYLPPLSLAVMMILFSATWRADRRRTWGMCALAFLVAMLALPSIDAIRFEPASEWLLRLVLVGAVGLLALVVTLLRVRRERWLWLLIALVALAGALLPMIALQAVRPAIEWLLQEPVGIGIGAWLNTAGHLLVLLLALLQLSTRKATA